MYTVGGSTREATRCTRMRSRGSSRMLSIGLPARASPKLTLMIFRVPSACVGRSSAGKMDRVAQMRLPRRAIFSGPPHLTSDPYARRGFKIKTAENPHGVEGMDLGRGFRPGKRRSQVETFHARAEIRGVQANDLGIVGRRLGKQILVGPDEVGKFHSLLVGIAPWPEHMPIKVDRKSVV